MTDAKLDLARHDAPATQRLQWLSRCPIVVPVGRVILLHAVPGQPTYALLTYAIVACQSL